MRNIHTYTTCTRANTHTHLRVLHEVIDTACEGHIDGPATRRAAVADLHMRQVNRWARLHHCSL